VYIDVHKAIRRMAPAPKARVHKGQIVENTDNAIRSASPERLIDLGEDLPKGAGVSATTHVSGNGRSNGSSILGTSPKTTFIKRSLSGADGDIIQIRGNVNDMREHLKHLGPSNLASRPKTTRYNTVKIKPGHLASGSDSRTDSATHRDSVIEEEPYRDLPAPSGGEGEGLLTSAGKEASDGVQALRQGYGSINLTSGIQNKFSESGRAKVGDATREKVKSSRSNSNSQPRPETGRVERHHSGRSNDTQESSDSRTSSPVGAIRRIARSGSITENVIEAGGVRKVVLETNSSSGEDKDERSSRVAGQRDSNSPKSSTNGTDGHPDFHDEDDSISPKGEIVKKKRRRTRKKKGGKGGEDGAVAGSSTQGGK